MKKRNITALAIMLASIIIMVVIFLYVKASSNRLAIIQRNVKTEDSVDSSVAEFTVKEGEKIYIKRTSSIEKGTLVYMITDTKGQVIEHFTPDTAAIAEILIEEDGTYCLKVSYENFIGKFKLVVTKEDSSA